ncbi:hypothetical protein QEH59_18260 [Coraliomargarita sp. SDUM461004]|uniref:Uncharacterized protein n=1 Tax=Thalassobacterium sedimentorum TaxID=3041258 RepID=A0ABU1ANL4_9BACT|nr:hypothetical protein [Coraliomargarita sp. SDUM461004]MDQ8196380.1 hypothetical protein [Coraliomargarita sp. SDUM461004]
MDQETLKNELREIAKIVKEFPEAVQQEAFAILTRDLTSDFSPQASPSKKAATRKATADVPSKPKGASKVPSKKPSGGKESYSIDRHLDLTESGSIPSFKDFHTEKNPKTAAEFTAVAVYYLVKLRGSESASLDHLYTCYAEVKKKQPKAFRQSVNDTKSKQGWVEWGSESDQIVIPHRGTVFVEHDLPRNEPAK